MMSNGQMADVPYINMEPQGPIGKKAQLEIEKIRMTIEEKEQMEYFEEQAKLTKLE